MRLLQVPRDRWRWLRDLREVQVVVSHAARRGNGLDSGAWMVAPVVGEVVDG